MMGFLYNSRYRKQLWAELFTGLIGIEVLRKVFYTFPAKRKM